MYGHKMSESPPNLEYLMASVIRLMAACTENPCPQQARTLLHLLDYLAKHPRVDATPGVAGAVGQAAAIWRARLAELIAPGGHVH